MQARCLRSREVMDEQIALAAKLIKESNRIVAMSGAGISTEAGIPDFRGQSGLWNNPQLLSRMSKRGFQSDPAGFYKASMELLPNLTSAEPTSAHRLLADLEENGKLIAVITQNIDGLHQAAGSKTVYEIHGNGRSGHCTRCSAAFEMAKVDAGIEKGEPLPPLCPDCQWPIKPDVVLFDELLPIGIWQAAERAVQQCELLMVFGSSLVVYPAAELPMIALKNKAKLIIVNLDPTDYDSRATVVIHRGLSAFAEAVTTAL